jgi:hypothetical protein
MATAKRPDWGIRILVGVLVLLVLGTIIGGIVERTLLNDGDDPAPVERAAPSTTTEDRGPRSDNQAFLACTHFRNVMADVDAGILTDVELRKKLQEVNDDARLSDVERVRVASVALLRAMTIGDPSGLPGARRDMTVACIGVD